MTGATILAATLVALVLAGCDSKARLAAKGPAASASTQAERLAEALADPDPYGRAERLGALLPSLGPEAIPEVARTLDQFRLELGAVEFELLVRFWATHEPAAATAFTFKQASALYQLVAARTTIEIWAEADPAAAVVAVESALRDANVEVSRAVQLALVRGWFKTDRPGLEQYIYGLGSGIQRQRSVFAYLLALASAEGTDAVVRWGESVPEDDRRYKRMVYRQVIAALAWADMAAAMHYCDAHCDGPYGKGLRNVIVRTRLRNGEYGGDVVEWVASVPDGDDQQRANKRHSLWVAYATWAYRDKQPAVDWMAQKTAEEEPEPWLRLLFAEYARQLAQDSPKDAIRWAERVEDEGDRERTLIKIARFWRSQNEEAAEAWLSQSPLSQQARKQARVPGKPSYLPPPAQEPR